jgi:2-(3-amino-3-carboxypropyl)histidine synthase
MSESNVVRNVSSGAMQRIRPLLRRNQIPDDILHNNELNKAIAILPSNYNFEIHKSIWKIRQAAGDKSIVVALQMPEGLLMYACIIADIIKRFASCSTIIMGDVTYGACCVDDFTADKLGAQFMIHFGHSCLVPINVTKVPTLYVFVEIQFDISHLCEVIRDNFNKDDRLVLMGTIQFTNMAYSVLDKLKDEFIYLTISQAKPLSAGETLGCTSPVLPADTSALVFVADGRFHLESVMIQNPLIPAFRYDPYAKTMTHETYDVDTMKATRLQSINTAKNCKVFGLILGTLGRQGSPGIFNRLQKLLTDQGKVVIPFLMAEINPEKLAKITAVEAWVQVACPRLSIDWSGGFSKPILTPYELEVALGSTQWTDTYPMDYYSSKGGSWTNLANR